MQAASTFNTRADMERIEINVTTGEKKVVQLTPEEVEIIQARIAAEAAKPKVKTIEERLAACEVLLGIRR